METESVLARIKTLEQEIALLPEGGISKKKIKGKDYYYHRITREGKRTETYLSFEKVPEFQVQIEKRKELESELKKLKRLAAAFPTENYEEKIDLKTSVLYGSRLELAVSAVKEFPQRSSLNKLMNYISGPVLEKVFIIYGLRRTGKTTLMRQAIMNLSEPDFKKAAYIQISSTDTISDVYSDLDILKKHGFTYIFIDEVTLLNEFVEGAALFADHYAAFGMKIILTGNDTMKFAFSAGDQLYDRCYMLHTTYIPYKEYSQLQNIQNLHGFLQSGGCVSCCSDAADSDIQSAFSNVKNTSVYIQTAIGNNIVNSLKQKDGSCRTRKLQPLYDSGELGNTVRSVITNINKDYCRLVLEKSFVAMAAMTLMKDKTRSFDLKQHINNDPSSMAVIQMQDILSKSRQASAVDDKYSRIISEYLRVMDVTADIDVESLPDTSVSKLTVFTQQGLRYSQISALIETLLNSAVFKNLSIQDIQKIKNITSKVLSEQMTEDLILLETKLANPDKKVFRIKFNVGGFDMVIFDPKSLNCSIFEIKHTDERSIEQHHHLIDEQKCLMTAKRYGDIIGKYVIYPGENAEFEGIQYINTEEYLKTL